MGFCINPRRFGGVPVIGLALLLLLPMAASAEGIAVKSAELELAEEAFVLHAELEVGLSPALEDALNKGVPLNFIVDFELKKPRWYWLDETIVTAQRHLRLSYHALTRQYQINVDGQHQNFSSLAEARHDLGRLQGWRVVEKSLLVEKQPATSKVPTSEKPPATDKPPAMDKAAALEKVPASDKAPVPEKTSARKRNTAYVAGLRMKLDLAQLPKPLQVNALTSKDWNLDSEWHRWNVTP